jgi:hypothetical protein
MISGSKRSTKCQDAVGFHTAATNVFLAYFLVLKK